VPLWVVGRLNGSGLKKGSHGHGVSGWGVVARRCSNSAREPEEVSPCEGRTSTASWLRVEYDPPMTTLLIWALIAAVGAVAFWIGHLVKDLNDRFDQIENTLDLILDHVKNK
jgi:hypothetical protein